MAIETGIYKLTKDDITAKKVTIPTSHTSLSGEATCQCTAPRAALGRFTDVADARMKCLKVSAVEGNLEVVTINLHAGERISWMSDTE